MQFTVDTKAQKLTVTADDGGTRQLELYSPEAFSVLSRAWVTTGWGCRYTYGFSWMGRPVIQLPEDLVTLQEVIYRVRPDVIVETGIAHGGSLVFSAALCRAMGTGRVIGVDIDIRPHNRSAIEEHELHDLITLVEGSSTNPKVVEQVRSSIAPEESVLVVLDSNHSKAHVTGELDSYAPMVTSGSYIVATDGVMEWLAGAPGAEDSWVDDNPARAVDDWLPHHPEFVLEDPPAFAFNEGTIQQRVTHWPRAWLRRLGPAEA